LSRKYPPAISTNKVSITPNKNAFIADLPPHY
jgi:hypothetical protein